MDQYDILESSYTAGSLIKLMKARAPVPSQEYKRLPGFKSCNRSVPVGLRPPASRRGLDVLQPKSADVGDFDAQEFQILLRDFAIARRLRASAVSRLWQTEL